MRPFFLIRLIILLLFPPLFIYPQSDPFPKPIEQRFSLFDEGCCDYDDILALIQSIENETLKVDSESELLRLKRFIGLLAFKGQFIEDENELAFLDDDIDSLFETEDSFYDLSINGQGAFYYPANYLDEGVEILLCEGWIPKKCKQVKKFIKKHKKCIIIGGSVVAAAATVIIGTKLAEKYNPPSSHLGCSPYECTRNEPQELPIQRVIDNQLTTLKERLDTERLLNNSEMPLEECGRIIGQVLAENSLAEIEGSCSLETQYLVDCAFSTQYADYEGDLGDRLYHLSGAHAYEVSQYEQAVDDLTNAIDINPDNHEAYLDRAVSYLELQNYSHSLADYNQYIAKKPTHTEYALDFGRGFCQGFPRGVKTSGSELGKFASNAFFHPINTSAEISKAFGTLAKLAYSQEWGTICHALAPEIVEVVNQWKELTPHQQGDKAGFIVGKYGTDFALPAVSLKAASKCAKAAKHLASIQKTLKTAEKTLAIETFIQTGKVGLASGVVDSAAEALVVTEKLCEKGRIGNIAKATERAGQIAEETSVVSKELIVLEEIAVVETGIAEAIQEGIASNIGSKSRLKELKEYFQPYRNKNFTDEAALRKVIHNAGIKTFPRPIGIPDHYLMQITEKSGGMKYIHPKKENIYVRVMPGKSHSPNPLQREPYVIHRVGDYAVDKCGNFVHPKSCEAHIPLNEYIYRIFE